MPEPDLVKSVALAESRARPVLVQMPQQEYEAAGEFVTIVQ